MNVISSRLERRIRRDFVEPGVALAVRDALSELDDTDLAGAERIQAAILLCVYGDPQRIEMCFGLARLDWRDILVGEGLGDADWPDKLTQESGRP